jgi:hypothetical protein
MSISSGSLFKYVGEAAINNEERRRDCMKEKRAKIEMFINNRLG